MKVCWWFWMTGNMLIIKCSNSTKKYRRNMKSQVTSKGTCCREQEAESSLKLQGCFYLQRRSLVGRSSGAGWRAEEPEWGCPLLGDLAVVVGGGWRWAVRGGSDSGRTWRSQTGVRRGQSWRQVGRARYRYRKSKSSLVWNCLCTSLKINNNFIFLVATLRSKVYGHWLITNSQPQGFNTPCSEKAIAVNIASFP